MAPWAAWIGPFIVYAFSLQSAVSFWDTGEAQVVPWIFGVAHPTGFPVFIIAAGVFAHLFAIGTVAWRIALFCALAMSVAAWAIFRILRELDTDPLIAVAAAWIFAFGDVVWVRGTRAEVHALATAFAALTLYFATRWYVRRAPRSLIAGAFCWGLGIATHPIVAMLAPALLVIFLARIRTVSPRSFALAACALFGGVAFYAYLPIRSAVVTQAHLDPTRSIGEPPGKAFWDLDHPSTWKGFESFISGSDYGAGGVFSSMLLPQTYASGIPPFFEQLWNEFTPAGVLLAIGGLVLLLRAIPPLGLTCILAVAVPAAFAFGYTIEADIARYYLIPFAVTAVFVGYGADRIARALHARNATLLVLAAVAAGLLILNRATFGQPASSGARAMIETVRTHTVDGAILLAPWMDSTALAYAAYVEHSLGSRIVDSAWLNDEKKNVPRWIAQGRAVYVIDQIYGSVPGYALQKIPGDPDVYRIVKE